MSFEPIINIDSISTNIAYQYSESVNLKQYLSVLLTPFDDLEQVFADILNKRMFSDATTDTLNTWGIIVDQTRASYDSNEIPFFGLDADDINNPVFHEGLGDLNDAGVGAIFRSVEQPIGAVTEVNNDAYKDLLRGKAHKNNFVGGTEALIDTIKDIFGITTTGAFQIEEIFTSPSDPYVKITFLVPLTRLQKSYLDIMDILPKPGGVRYEYVYA